jgi:anaerobic selenocysteine-containing dehydrogenase
MPPAEAARLTGLPAATIESLAREIASTHPTAIRANYGIQRSDRGGRAMQAVASLAAITGQFAHQGGGFNLSTSGGFAGLNRAALERQDLEPHPTRLLNMTQLGDILTSPLAPPVKALINYNSNPAAIAPDQNKVLSGLEREDLFTVVVDQFMTDTALRADIVLPATTFLEHTDLYFAYGHYHLQLARPALPAPGECRSNVETFRALAHAMGFTDPCFNDTDDDMIRQLLTTDDPFLQGITLEQLDAQGHVRLKIPENFQPFADGQFPTAHGKFITGGSELKYEPPIESRFGPKSEFPLELITWKNHNSMNSTFGVKPDVDQETAVAYLHPQDAATRQITDGQTIRLFNARGQVLVQAKLDAELVQPGVVCAPSVRWPSKSPDGRGVNVLTSQRLTDLGNGATFYSCLVEVAPCA